MPAYHYRSEPPILLKNINIDLLKGMEIFIEDPDNPGDSRLIWVVTHSMVESPIIVCPITGQPAVKTMLGCAPEWYIKGNGLARDKAGARRDMNLHRLQNGDPYAAHRQPGEADDLANRLRKGGRFNPKTQYFTP